VITVLIPDGHHQFSTGVILSLLKDPRIKVYSCIDQHPKISPQLKDKMAKAGLVQIEVPFPRRSKGWIHCLLQCIKAYNIDILAPIGLSTIQWMKTHAHVFPPHIRYLTSPPLTHLVDADDKHKLSQWATKLDIDIPPTLNLKDATDEALNTFTFPALLKPTLEKGGKGIHYIDSKATLTTFTHTYENKENWMVQSHISGIDYSVNILANTGKIIAYTAQKGLLKAPGKPFAPSPLINVHDNPDLYKIVEKFVTLTQWDGVANFDFIYSNADNRYYLLEINPRYWQSLMASVSAGVNFPVLHCLTTMGHPLPTNLPPITPVLFKRFDSKKQWKSYIAYTVAGYFNPLPRRSNWDSL
jgi:predicted ATP-grasp superfamily ATP-dependent carboligase